MNFSRYYTKALLSERTGTTDYSQQYYPEFPDVSEAALNTFFYVQGFCTFMLSYPYCCEMKNFDSYYLLYTVSGHGQLYYQDKSYDLLPDTFVFLNCQEYHRIEVPKLSKLHYHGLFLNGSTLAQYYQLYAQKQFVLCPASGLSCLQKTIERLLLHQKSQTRQKELINSKIITDLLTNILIEKNRFLEPLHDTPDYICMVKQLFDTHYTESHSLDLLSNRFGISKYKLVREFTAFLSVSPIRYLINVRMEAAKDMLWQTNKTIGEIADSVGIENVSHFIKLFKQYSGFTPKLYRKQRPKNMACYLQN